MSFETAGPFNPDEADYSIEENDFETTEAREEELKELLEDADFDIPPMRLENRDWKWINRNLGMKPENRENSKYEEAVGLLKKILQDEFLEGVM